MISIEIGEMGESSPTWLGLNESDMLAGVVSSDYEPTPKSDEIVREQLEIHLRGDPEVLRQAVRQLESLVAAANRYDALRVGKAVYLRFSTSEADAYWFARIFSVTLTGQKGYLASHDLGAMTLALAFERENHFESEPVLLSLSNSGGGPTSDPLTVYNHCDATPGHANYLEINASLFDSDLPARLRLEMTNTGATIGDIHVGLIAWPVDEAAGTLNLEAEGATPATVSSNAAASGGQVSTLTWSGTAWTQLTTWTLGQEALQKFACTRFLPILRCPSGLSGGPMQLRLSLSVQGNLVYESSAKVVPDGAAVVIFDPTRLPLNQTQMLLPAAPYALSLSAQCDTAGTHTLVLDDLCLLPLESACFFRSFSGLVPGAVLVDDSSTDYSATVLSGQEARTHTRVGKELQMMPGRVNRVCFFMTTPTGMAPIDLKMSVNVTARKRRRVL